jgi:hypothetical protein
MTRGLKSSEFLITLLALIAGAGLAVYGVEAGIIASVLSPAIAFIGSRGAVKFKQGES